VFDETVIRKLKQSNVSVDAEKTKERTETLWKTLSRKDKQAVIALADISSATIYRIYNTGSISAKLAVPLAQTLNVSPLYLTGASDEQGECNDEVLKEFLTDHGYAKLLASVEKPKAKRQPRANKESSAEDASAAPYKPEAESTMAEMAPANVDVAENDMIFLLRSVLLKARLGAPNAAHTVDALKKLLISE